MCEKCDAKCFKFYAKYYNVIYNCADEGEIKDKFNTMIKLINKILIVKKKKYLI